MDPSVVIGTYRRVFWRSEPRKGDRRLLCPVGSPKPAVTATRSPSGSSTASHMGHEHATEPRGWTRHVPAVTAAS